MAKKKIIWSRTAKKILYAIFESDIQKGAGKDFSKKLFKSIFKDLKHLRKHTDFGVKTSDGSLLALVMENYLVFYEISNTEIIIHSVETTD